jgi:ElaB/YqjD/DUF883 family membrane-anchored ribosome-binding protein
MTPENVEQQTQADDPEELRREIEQTREELGDTVEALSDKADVKGQIKEKIAGARERATDATPDDAKEAALLVKGQAEERPLPAIAAALLVGALLGWLIGRR